LDYLAWLQTLGWILPISQVSLAGAGNNRTLRLESPDRQAVLKHYRSAERLKREVDFCERAGHRVRLPRLQALHPEEPIALWSIVDGAPAEGPVQPGWVEQAAEFVIALNQPPRPPFDPAVEAGYSQSQHWLNARIRIERLQQARVATKLVQDFERELLRLRDTLELHEPVLAAEARCLSPSDFGFHNAVVDAGNGLTFVDFEYAGEDDPVKLICDFDCQPRLPVPQELRLIFATRLAESGIFRQDLRGRAERLWPLFRLRWACIMLNPLLAGGAERQRFLDHPPESAQAIEERSWLYWQACGSPF
jgi:hypothetical protein